MSVKVPLPLCVVLVLLSFNARAEYITGYSADGYGLNITHMPFHTWVKGESICAVKNQKKMVCGEVSSADKSDATMKITSQRGGKLLGAATHCPLNFLLDWQYQMDKIAQENEIPLKERYVVELGQKTADFTHVTAEGRLNDCTKIASAKKGKPVIQEDQEEENSSLKSISSFGLDRLNSLGSKLTNKKHTAIKTEVSVLAKPVPALPVTKNTVSTPAPQNAPSPVSPPPVVSNNEEDAAKQAERSLTQTEAPATLSSNLALGFDFIFPMLHYQQRVTEHFSLGLNSLLINYSSSGGPGGVLAGYAVYLTVNYYGERPFSGLWLRMSGGAGFLTTHFDEGEQKGTSLSVAGLLGWRWLMESSLNFGFGFGLSYFADSQLNVADPAKPLIFPSINLDIGFAF